MIYRITIMVENDKEFESNERDNNPSIRDILAHSDIIASCIENPTIEQEKYFSKYLDK